MHAWGACGTGFNSLHPDHIIIFMNSSYQDVDTTDPKKRTNGFQDFYKYFVSAFLDFQDTVESFFLKNVPPLSYKNKKDVKKVLPMANIIFCVLNLIVAISILGFFRNYNSDYLNEIITLNRFSFLGVAEIVNLTFALLLFVLSVRAIKPLNEGTILGYNRFFYVLLFNLIHTIILFNFFAILFNLMLIYLLANSKSEFLRGKIEIV
jgi:hypothetical protein